MKVQIEYNGELTDLNLAVTKYNSSDQIAIVAVLPSGETLAPLTHNCREVPLEDDEIIVKLHEGRECFKQLLDRYPDYFEEINPSVQVGFSSYAKWRIKRKLRAWAIPGQLPDGRVRPALQWELQEVFNLPDDQFAYQATDLFVIYSSRVAQYLIRNYEFDNCVRTFTSPKGSNWAGAGKDCIEVAFAGIWPDADDQPSPEALRLLMEGKKRLSMEESWNAIAAPLKGRVIQDARYTPDKEHGYVFVLTLDGGVELRVMADDEGNAPGALHCVGFGDKVLPSLKGAK